MFITTGWVRSTKKLHESPDPEAQMMSPETLTVSVLLLCPLWHDFIFKVLETCWQLQAPLVVAKWWIQTPVILLQALIRFPHRSWHLLMPLAQVCNPLTPPSKNQSEFRGRVDAAGSTLTEPTPQLDQFHPNP